MQETDSSRGRQQSSSLRVRQSSQNQTRRESTESRSSRSSQEGRSYRSAQESGSYRSSREDRSSRSGVSSQSRTGRTGDERRTRQTSQTRKASSSSKRGRQSQRRKPARKTTGQTYQRRPVSERHYSEKYLQRKKKRQQQLRRRYLIIGIAALLFVLFMVAEIFPVYSSAKMEVGTNVSAKDFLRFGFMPAKFTGDSEALNTKVPGTYDVKIRAGIFNHKCKLTVVDSTAPELVVQDVSIGVGETCKPEDFVVSVNDATETTVRFSKAPDETLKGVAQPVEIEAEDAAGNVTVKTAQLTLLPIITPVRVELGSAPPGISSFIPDVTEEDESTYIATDLSMIDYNTLGEYPVDVVWQDKPYTAKMIIIDTDPPVFDMAENFTSYLGESIRYKAHVTVHDNSGSCELTVDTSKVDQDKVGDYEVTYTATDPYGNTASVTVTLTIAEKTANEEVLFQKVDEILSQIINDNMSAKEKVEAIHHYANRNFLFVSDSVKGDYVRAALDMLAAGQGDCYSFFSLSKALLTRAGIKNMDIGVLADDREHYWNLVDIDDGHGWYHYDSTPNLIGMDVIFWTEEMIQEVDDGRYSYDHSKYPAVP